MIRLCILLVVLTFSVHGQSGEQLGNWKLQQAGHNAFIPAPVPGNVYDALLLNNQIPDPYLGSNEDCVQWVAEKSWIYHTAFELSAEQLAKGPLLRFEGIDTYADIYLNGQWLGFSNNAFLDYQFPLDSLARLGTNLLAIHLLPIQATNDTLAAMYPHPLPEAHRVFVRKPAFHFGWDWGPVLKAGGLTGKVSLDFEQRPKIKHWQYHLLELTPQQAQIELHFSLQTAEDGWLQLELQGENFYFNDSLPIQAGDTYKKIRISIPNPKLWWANGSGQAHLYQLHYQLLAKGQRQQQGSEAIGIRTLDLIREADDYGRSFYFELNGKPIFIKGANYIPVSHLQNRPEWQNDSVLLERAAAAGINMLRVWGGGIYPSDAFYQLANRLGIMIWQDYMFACAMYPGDSLFLAGAMEEARYQTKRLRNHPSLALWCGNNENWEGWGNWGWQRDLGYTAADSAGVLQAYNRLFRQLLPEMLQQLDPQRSYTHSSPLNGWGRMTAYREGDVHYWGVWWGMAPITQYRKRVGRFVSEYGMQALPEFRSLQQMSGMQAPSLEQAEIKIHQKHPRGFESIHSYLEADFPLAVELQLYAYASQLMQAYALETAITAHRMAMPRCMGSMFWQWNDVWPAISWSVVDYFGHGKAAYYGLKQWYAPQLLSVERDSIAGKGGLVQLKALHEGHDSLQARLVIEWWSTYRKRPLRSRQLQLTLAPNKPSLVYQLSKSETRRLRNNKRFLVLQLQQDTSVLAESWWSAHPPKDQRWRNPKIELEPSDKGLLLSSRFPAKSVFLSLPPGAVHNYIDLLPRKKQPISLENPLSHFPPAVISFYDLLRP